MVSFLPLLGYHEKIGKYIEKPADRRSLKGQSFAKIFDEAFRDAPSDFFVNICMEADDIVIEERNYRDVYDKTLDSVFASESWKTSISTISRDCKIFSDIVSKQPCKGNVSKKPCIYHCSDSILADLIQSSMDKAFEKALEDNIIRISKSLAKKAWHHHDIYMKKIFRDEEILYKEAFAKFYHTAAFINIYNKAYDSCLGDVMNSHHVWCDHESSLDVVLCGGVEKHCNSVFERNFLGPPPPSNAGRL